ncbi:MAG TPA: sialidase family protein [Nitrososphaeraceae archaeon]|nr:sialidase family protein [Nitrososphaeraceae archaeon]
MGQVTLLQQINRLGVIDGKVKSCCQSRFSSLNIGVILLAANMVLGLVSFVAYQNSFAQSDGNDNIITNQVRFSEPVNLTNNARDSVYAQVASSGENVYIVWQENPPSGFSSQRDGLINYEIFIKKSVDGGQTFGDEINLSNNPGFSEHPQIAASGNNVYVAWIDNSPLAGSTSQAEDNKKIMFKKSTDMANTFGDTITLSDVHAADSSNLEMAAAGSNVYAVWQVTPLPPQFNADQDDAQSVGVFLAMSSDNGETFQEAKSLSNNVLKSYPKVAAYQNKVYVIWNVGIIGDNTNPENINNNNNNNNNNDSGTSNGIYLTKSFDSGTTFDGALKLNADWNSVGESQIAASGDSVYVVWGGNPDEKVAGNLFYASSIDNGASFSAARALTERNTLNAEVAAADNGNEVYLAWQGILPDDNEEIFVKRSADNGATFTELSRNVSNNEGISECTSISISDDSKKIYLAWEDSPAGNHEILFAHNI